MCVCVCLRVCSLTSDFLWGLVGRAMCVCGRMSLTGDLLSGVCVSTLTGDLLSGLVGRACVCVCTPTGDLHLG